MSAALVLGDCFERVRDGVISVVDGLGPDELCFRPAADANTIAWLVWHLTRIEDDHIAGLAGVEQVWRADGWCDRFSLPFDAGAIGYGHTTAEVGAVRATADDLVGYHQAAFAMAQPYVAALDESELARVVDRSWDPPVTAAVRLVSVVVDLVAHLGQAEYVRGLLP